MNSRSFVLLLAALLSGCFQGVPDDIPCDSDDTCPTGYFCGSLGTCRDLEVASPPELRVSGVSRTSNGPFGESVTLPSSGPFIAFYLAFENVGGSEANLSSIELSAPECFGLPASVQGRGSIAPGETDTVTVNYSPTPPCEAATAQVEVSATSGPSTRRLTRSWTGSFGVALAP